MSKDELIKKYPESTSIIKYEPVEDCSRCNGTGEYTNRRHEQGLCFCVCVDIAKQLHREINDALNKVCRDGRMEIKNARLNID